MQQLHGMFAIADLLVHTVVSTLRTKVAMFVMSNQVEIDFTLYPVILLCRCVSVRKTGRPTRTKRMATPTAVSSPASASDSSSDSGVHDDERDKRAQHNVMERQRRYNLKSHFYSLRDVVPGTRNDGRVSKVAILSRAAEHIHQLRAINEALQVEYSHQRALQERWKWKLSLVNREARQAAVCSA